MVRSSHSALALFCIALEFGSLAHMAVVRHEICAEHGEAVDVFHDAAHSHAVAVASKVRTVESRGDADSHEGHDHCQLACNRRNATCVESSSSVPAAIVSIASATSAFVERSTPTIALLDLAPKSSPPA